MRRLRTGVIVVLVGTGAIGLSACSGTTAPAAASSVSSPSIATPLSTSVETAAGTWATIPMGRLDQPLNTFWQLLFRPAEGPSWSDQVEATAVATNGGLVLASGTGGLVVGVEPSNRLSFSPLIESSDAGRTWANGLLSEGLADHPQALAYDGEGQALALIRESADGRTQLLESTEDLSSWQPLASQSSLAAATGARPCGLDELTAVSLLAGSPLVGAGCARPGVVGILTERAGSWELIGPSLPSTLHASHSEVLAMTTSASVLSAVIGLSTGTSTDLLAAWSSDGGNEWSSSPALPLTDGSQLVSVGPADGDGWFVLVDGGDGSETLDVVDGPAAPWVTLASPPRGTATVAFPPGVAPEALASHGATLDISTLDQGSALWIEDQRMNVPIQYGSSN